MSYHIFISHASSDKKIAEEVKRVINNAFEGDIVLYLEAHEIRGGDEWKSEIKKNLQRCEAIICIVTPDSANKPWLFIEWSAFWIQGKKYYVLLSDDLKTSDLIQAMQDRQATNMMDADAVKALFRALTEDSKHGATPYHKVEEFIETVRLARKIQSQENAEAAYSKYRKSLIDLPRDDLEKRKIAEFFYEKGEFEVFQGIINKIRDDSVKCDIALQLVDDGNLEQLSAVYRAIRSADRLSTIAIALIDKGYLDTRQLREILEDVSTKNQAELRKVGVHLADLGLEDTELFRYISDLMTNLAELRKLVVYFIDNNRLGKSTFDDMIEKFASNRAELRKVASYMIASGKQRSKQFALILEILGTKNQLEAEKVMEELYVYDRVAFEEYLSKGVITNKEALRRKVEGTGLSSSPEEPSV